ncbi:hypothetical protein LCL61_00575 [Amycolatopsis coloradensis]|uniref:Uncharacterized protein n=1 Tax=Amycolatopsis coloradensis TaxID=76021 RepID=A0ACD5B404_9PSEU
MDYPRPLEDREVLVARGVERRQARLRGWLDGYDGPRPLYRIELFLDGDRYTATAMDMFESLTRLRRQLEPGGWAIAVQGARRDTYPSGMCRDMGGGMRISVMRTGHETSEADLVDTLADAELDRIVTVAEQEAWHAEWWEAATGRRL